MEPDFWELKVGVEVSTMYHDWRRANVEGKIRFAKSATIAGATLTLATGLLTVFVAMPIYIAILPALFSTFIAVVNIVELASRWDQLALDHTDLYRRFSDLLAKMVRPTNPNDEMLHEWAAEAALIRKDEPPTFWGVYAVCWNQVMERHYGREASKYYRKVDRLRHFLRNLVQFQPADFPLAAERAATP